MNRTLADRHARLAERFGTPLYVYDLDEIDAARSELYDALPREARLFYALKANPHPDIARALGEGPGRPCLPEISSTGELAVALAAGRRGQDCLYTGPGKTAAELDEAIALGVRRFSTDSVTDVRRVGAAARAHGAVADCILRVNAPSARGTTAIRMTGTPSQFGFDAETLPDTLPLVRDIPGTRITGLHFFPLSNAQDASALIDAFRHSIILAAQLERDLGLTLRFLDLGGGFAAPYGVPGQRGAYPKLRAELEADLDLHLPGWRHDRPAVAFEAGRFLVGAGGTLIARVGNIKVSRGHKFVVLDAGINAFGGMSGLGRLLPVSVRIDGAAETETATLVGPLCTPGDVLGRGVELPVLEPGDLVSIPNAGAYGPTASLLTFLGRPAPAEVVVRGDLVVSASRLEHHRVALGGCS
ncbi:type III PLP-dependent enzyme [Streptomyces chlorus]|uniref:Type III PLP-dependent enzyme n=1 Tax=Streptomyces chlorus TaxID=887452 RepID=A0ABW1E7R8_9ACTN